MDRWCWESSSSLYIAANRVLLSFVVSRLKFESRRNTNRDIATHASNQTSIFQFGGFFLFHILWIMFSVIANRQLVPDIVVILIHIGLGTHIIVAYFSVFVICFVLHEYLIFWFALLRKNMDIRYSEYLDFFDIFEYSRIFTDISSTLFNTSKSRKNNTHLFFRNFFLRKVKN